MAVLSINELDLAPAQPQGNQAAPAAASDNGQKAPPPPSPEEIERSLRQRMERLARVRAS